MKVGNVLVKSVEQIEGIRESGKINTAVLDYVEAHIQAGISTEEIDRWVYEETVRMGAIPAPLNYEAFRRACVRPEIMLSAMVFPMRRRF